MQIMKQNGAKTSIFYENVAQTCPKTGTFSSSRTLFRDSSSTVQGKHLKYKLQIVFSIFLQIYLCLLSL